MLVPLLHTCLLLILYSAQSLILPFPADLLIASFADWSGFLAWIHCNCCYSSSNILYYHQQQHTLLKRSAHPQSLPRAIIVDVVWLPLLLVSIPAMVQLKQSFVTAAAWALPLLPLAVNGHAHEGVGFHIPHEERTMNEPYFAELKKRFGEAPARVMELKGMARRQTAATSSSSVVSAFNSVSNGAFTGTSSGINAGATSNVLVGTIPIGTTTTPETTVPLPTTYAAAATAPVSGAPALPNGEFVCPRFSVRPVPLFATVIEKALSLEEFVKVPTKTFSREAMRASLFRHYIPIAVLDPVWCQILPSCRANGKQPGFWNILSSYAHDSDFPAIRLTTSHLSFVRLYTQSSSILHNGPSSTNHLLPTQAWSSNGLHQLICPLSQVFPSINSEDVRIARMPMPRRMPQPMDGGRVAVTLALLMLWHVHKGTLGVYLTSRLSMSYPF